MVREDTQDSNVDGETCQILEIVIRFKEMVLLGGWERWPILCEYPCGWHNVEASLPSDDSKLIKVADPLLIQTDEDSVGCCTANIFLIQQLVKPTFIELNAWRVYVGSPLHEHTKIYNTHKTICTQWVLIKIL